jgi:hypothetical protein
MQSIFRLQLEAKLKPALHAYRVQLAYRFDPDAAKPEETVTLHP